NMKNLIPPLRCYQFFWQIEANLFILDLLFSLLASCLAFPSAKFRTERTVRIEGRTATLSRRNPVSAPRWATSAGSVMATSRDEQGAGERKQSISDLFPTWPFRSGGLKSPAPGWRGRSSPRMAFPLRFPELSNYENCSGVPW